MRIVMVLLAVMVGLGLIVVVLGYLLPVRHEVVVSARVPATPEQVWGALTDVSAYPTWRGDVQSVDIVPTDSGHVAWRETGKNGAISPITRLHTCTGTVRSPPSTKIVRMNSSNESVKLNKNVA